MMKILFVCMGNICRSPAAKGIFDARLRAAGLEVFTESAGTHDYHIGEGPDPRAITMTLERGIDIRSDRARSLSLEDFNRFDRIYVMDRANLARVERIRPERCRAEVGLVMELASDYGIDEVPDPYYGGEAGFRQVLDMLEAAADSLAEEISRVAR